MILDGKMATQFMNVLQCLMPNIGKKKKKMTLPSEILAFKLLKRANITKEENGF